MSFKKGVSGNPGGRPKALGEQQAAFRKYTPEVREKLLAIIRSPKTPAAVCVTACSVFLDRGLGKPAQSLAIGINGKTPDEMTDAELLAIVAGDETSLDDSAPVDETTH